MSEDERIRRAEIISERRNNRIPVSNINSSPKKQKSFLGKLSLQILSSICIFGLLYFLTQNHSYAIDFIKPVISNDTDFQKIYTDINNAIKNIKNSDEYSTNTQDVNENHQSEDNQEQNAENQNNQEQAGAGGGENNTELSKDEKDIEFVKKHASFIKPVNGTITSPYGTREATEVISANHAGVDIGAEIGTEIIASMEGDAETVSSEGEYGNHIKITNGEISTIYAHCSKILVNQGEHIIQGQKIAEVGTTGKSTGPHLHFEIRRNDIPINPQEILEF